MEANWVPQCLEKSLAGHGKPGILNSDQGNQYTSEIFTNILKINDIQISMDGKGRAIDNVFIERLWRSVKYECVYIDPPADGYELENQLRKYFHFYNHELPHQSLGYKYPASMYFDKNLIFKNNKIKKETRNKNEKLLLLL